MAAILNSIFSSSSSSRPQYQHKPKPRSLDAPPPLPPASSWARHRAPNHRRTVSFDASSGDSSNDDPPTELVILRKENRRFKRKIDHLALQKDVYHDLLEKSGIEIPEVLEKPSPRADDNEPAVVANIKRSDTATARTDTTDPIPYWINPSSPQAKLLQLLIAILLGRARTILRTSPTDHAKIETLAAEAYAHSLHSSLKKDRALMAHCQFYLGLARFGQRRYPEAAEYLDNARAAVAARYLDGEVVDGWVDRCSDAMGETQSTTWTDPKIPSERAPQTNSKGKGKGSAAPARTHHRHSSSAHSILSSATTVRPASPPPSNPFEPSYLHSYASATHSPSPPPRPLPADFPLLTLVDSRGNSSATVMPTSPNAFSAGGAFSSPPSSLEGSPEPAQGAFEQEPFIPTHRRGRSGGNGSGARISSKLAFWEGQRSDGRSDSSPVEGGQRRQQQQNNASPQEQEVVARQGPYQPPFLASEAGGEADDDSEDEQRRQFLDQKDASSTSSSDDDKSSTAGNQGEVLANYFNSRTNSYASDAAPASSIQSPSSSLSRHDPTGSRRTPAGDQSQSPMAGQGETVAPFWSSRTNSLRSYAATPPSRTNSLRSSDAAVTSPLRPQPSRPTSSSSSARSESRPTDPGPHAPSVHVPSTRPSRAQSLLSRASSLRSVAEREEEEERGEWERQPSRGGSSGGSEGDGRRTRRKGKGSRRERRASRAVAAGAGGS